jgi:hypothetical protein
MAIPKAFSVRKFIFVSAIQVNNKYASGEIFLTDPAAGESGNRCRRLVRKEYYVIFNGKVNCQSHRLYSEGHPRP